MKKVIEKPSVRLEKYRAIADSEQEGHLFFENYFFPEIPEGVYEELTLLGGGAAMLDISDVR